MKYYEKLLQAGCFTKNEILHITGREGAANWVCSEYRKKGLIEQVKRDLYVTVSLEDHLPVCNRYTIASHISKDAVVSYHSAFDFYGFSNQIYYDMYVTTETRFRTFDFDGFTYRRMAPRIKGGILNIDGIRVTSIERTVLDSINIFEKNTGLEEILRCIALIPSLDENRLVDLLEEYDNRFLYQKAGYILSSFREDLHLSDRFFDYCRGNIPRSKSYFFNDNTPQPLNREWNIYAPVNLSSITDKGVIKDALC